jgi:hypothetical protein
VGIRGSVIITHDKMAEETRHQNSIERLVLSKAKGEKPRERSQGREAKGEKLSGLMVFVFLFFCVHQL